MFERDKDDLRAFGIPLRTIAYTVDGLETEGYEITRRDFYLPYLKIVAQTSDDVIFESRAREATVEVKREDAPLALDGLRRVSELPSFPLAAEARSAFRKLAFDLDASAFTADSPVVFVDRASNAEEVANLRTLSDALLKHKTVRFRYHGIRRNEETAREVNGYGLLFQGGQWYLVGYDLTREDMRVFRTGRMDDVVMNTKTPNTPDYEVKKDFSLAAYVGRQAWELGDQDEAPIAVRVLFRFPLSLWAERNGHGTLEQSNADGSAVRSFVVHQANPFLRWLLGMQSDVEVLEPRELAAELKQIAQRIARAHSGDGDAGE